MLPESAIEENAENRRGGGLGILKVDMRAVGVTGKDAEDRGRRGLSMAMGVAKENADDR